MRKSFLFVLLFLGFACLVSADISVVIKEGKAVDGNNAALTVSAVDANGKPIKNLQRYDFELLVNKKKIRDIEVNPVPITNEPLSIILGIDNSSSMGGKSFNETQNAISTFLDRLNRADFVSLLSFGRAVTFLTEFTREKYLVRSQVQSMRPAGNTTSLYSGIREAIRKGKSAPTQRSAVILITDGEDGGSSRGMNEAIELAKTSSIPVYTIGIGNNLNRDFLQEIGQVSGGGFISTTDTRTIPGLYRNVLDQLKSQYQIIFPFDKEPSVYTADLTLTFGRDKASTTKDFSFNPSGTANNVSSQPSTQPPVSTGTTGAADQSNSGLALFVKIVIVVLCILLVVLVVIYYRERQGRLDRDREDKNERELRERRLLEMLQSESAQQCELEYPAEHQGDSKDFFSKSSGMTKLPQMTRVSRVSSYDVILQVDGLKRSVPLVEDGVNAIEDLIIAKKSGEKSSYRKQGAVYLWTQNEVVSRPNRSRNGHSRIFADTGDVFIIEDLGSTNGTWIGDKRIERPYQLKDNDAIYVGGPEGVRIVFKEVRLDFEKPSE